MCEEHTVREPFWMKKLMLLAYGKWVDDTLDYYLFLGRMTRVPLIGRVVHFFAEQYGKYMHGGRAATADECIGVLAGARQIAIMDCSCRVKYDNCDKPIRTCIAINTGAEVLGSLRKEQLVSIEEAVRIVREAPDHGLIRSITHCVLPDQYVICNCCTCCCVPYRLRSEYGIRSAVEDGFYAAQINTGSCLKCGRCLDKCPQDAIDIDQGTIDAAKCLGCGNCFDNCPHNAIQMVVREDRKPVMLPGRAARFLMYTVFLAVILPLAGGYKLLHTSKGKLSK
ncbi:4Fe-4S binding protein [Phosphitispora fastidiosa]|uniref:4Fe-4S binding protein n=1 Tax=Phosphitispora fastidiosa TaxID=2837202 RepID=UPI001E5C3ECE|nr:4Fe-4S binding protein [Phosphitispora fastidiosa]MBU7007311.1 NAD-dependent dihydropyrimidine dehydrogenase PreA subunit [Phosphitispora fastidiosa]